MVAYKHSACARCAHNAFYRIYKAAFLPRRCLGYYLVRTDILHYPGVDEAIYAKAGRKKSAGSRREKLKRALKMKKKFDKIKIIRAILLALIISVMAAIFVFSAQGGEESGATSEGFTAFVLGIFGINESNTTPENLKEIESFVRTAAHFSEYAALGFLCNFFLGTYSLKRAKSLMLAVGFSAFYAVTDEIHQIFVPGRAAQFSDFMVDTSGALFGACMALLLAKLCISVSKIAKIPKKTKNKKKKCS